MKYEVTYINLDDKYVTSTFEAKSIKDAKNQADKFGTPIRVYLNGILQWEKIAL